MAKHPPFSKYLAFGIAGVLAVLAAWLLLPPHHPPAPESQPQPSLFVQSPPHITWQTPPNVPAGQDRISLDFSVNLSAPLRQLDLHLTQIGAPAHGGNIQEAVTETIPLRQLIRDGNSQTIHWDGAVDLTQSLLAGNQASLILSAEDEDRRSGSSDAVMLTLPEKKFTNPTAKTIYAVRKLLLEHPERRMDGLRVLATLLQQRDLFSGQNLALLSLRSAAVRIALDRSAGGTHSALNLLWHAALLFEEPNVLLAKQSPIPQ